jgi:pantoate--beta-alanine ligase
MEVFTSISALRIFLDKCRATNQQIGLVPTMGALHDGHVSLVKAAREQVQIVVCSIFINPIQFNNKEDLDKYPRTLDQDCEALERAGCSAVFAPSADEMYSTPPELKMHFGNLETVMEGASRPGHFNGVGIVVSRLFNIVQPHYAYFGQKDLQQVAVINRLVRDLAFSLQLVACPTLRETDGLAMSSRNARLNADERALAPFIYQVLTEAKKQLLNGCEISRVIDFAKEQFGTKDAFKLDYFEAADATTLQPIRQLGSEGTNAICAAVYLGAVRLIDNIVF